MKKKMTLPQSITGGNEIVKSWPQNNNLWERDHKQGINSFCSHTLLICGHVIFSSQKGEWLGSFA